MKVLVLSDKSLFLKGVESLLANEHVFVENSIDVVHSHSKYDLVLVDGTIINSRLDVKHIREESSALWVVPRSKVDFFIPFVQNQNWSFVFSDEKLKNIQSAINYSLQKKSYKSNAFKMVLLEKLHLNQDRDDQWSKLSKREIEIAELMGEGHSSQQIATYLNLSIHTVYTHRKRILKKLEVQSAGELISVYLKRKVIS